MIKKSFLILVTIIGFGIGANAIISNSSSESVSNCIAYRKAKASSSDRNATYWIYNTCGNTIKVYFRYRPNANERYVQRSCYITAYDSYNTYVNEYYDFYIESTEIQ